MWEGQAQGLMVLDVTTKEAEEVPGEQAVRSILHSLCLERLPDLLRWWTMTWNCELKQILPFQVAVGHGFIKVEGTLMKAATDLRTVNQNAEFHPYKGIWTQ